MRVAQFTRAPAHQCTALGHGGSATPTYHKHGTFHITDVEMLRFCSTAKSIRAPGATSSTSLAVGRQQAIGHETVGLLFNYKLEHKAHACAHVARIRSHAKYCNSFVTSCISLTVFLQNDISKILKSYCNLLVFLSLEDISR